MLGLHPPEHAIRLGVGTGAYSRIDLLALHPSLLVV